MTTKRVSKFLSLILGMMLIVAMAFHMTACGDNNTETPELPTEGQGSEAEKTVLGEGEVQFLFEVVDKEGAKTVFEIHTDKTTVGEALQELGLIEGEDSAYGLYVKKVNGILADYNVNGTYWAFYVNGKMAMSGVDTTNIKEGATYSFKVEK